MTYGRKTGGRKKGTPNKVQKARSEALKGKMPLDVMMDAMRYHWLNFEAERSKPTAEQDNSTLREHLAGATQMAEKAAPYYHPKLATLQSNVNLTGRLTLEQLVMQSLEGAANSNETAKLIEGKAEEA